MPEKYTAADLNELAEYLTRRSKEICKDNECTEDEHNCESFAYFDSTLCGDDLIDLSLIDICLSDYLTTQANCYIDMPFTGTGADLLEMIIKRTDWSPEADDRGLLAKTSDEDLPLIAGQIKTSEGEQELKRRIDGFNQDGTT